MGSPVPPQQAPSLPWRATSTVVMGLVGSLSRGFMYGLNKTEVTGLDRFLELLDRRSDVEKRARGLITVSNHISVLDDPIMWGALPLKYLFNPSTMRWGLGAHDICFKNKAMSTFFTFGQTLPVHRSNHSKYGGPFQPTMTQAIRLLSAQPYTSVPDNPHISDIRISDPFSSGALTYSTNGTDVFPAPSVYRSNRHAWVHVFPEGCVHQHDTVDVRYFKWGVSRLILESEPAPDVVPMFIDGTQHVMHESRTFPRFLPRIGARIRMAFGEAVDTEKRFGDLRRRWKSLVEKSRTRAAELAGSADVAPLGLGQLTDDLEYGREAQEIRSEVALRVREEVMKVRESMGYPAPDPSYAFAETWAVDPDGEKKFKSKVDGSEINQN